MVLEQYEGLILYFTIYLKNHPLRQNIYINLFLEYILKVTNTFWPKIPGYINYYPEQNARLLESFQIFSMPFFFRRLIIK